MSSDVRPPVDDVRMRGFGKLTPVRDVLSHIGNFGGPCEAEMIPIQDAGGRVLAKSVVSPINVPSHRRAAMDGYAVAAAELPGGFSIIGEAKPGQPFAEPLQAGQAVRVMTGAPVPDGADVVVPVERCEATAVAVNIPLRYSAGKHVIAVGEDVAEGEEVLRRLRALRPQDVGLLSSLGIASASVVAKPRVKLLITGGELLPPGSPPSGFHIADSNSVMLRAFVERDGGVVTATVRVPDDPDRLRAEMTGGEWDLLLVSGGTSVGVDDHAPNVLRELAAWFFHGLAMRPGMPAGYGVFPNGRIVYLLPGNPVACLFAYDLLARVSLRRLAGLPTDWPYQTISLPLTSAIESKAGRVDYVRVIVAFEHADLVPRSGAANLSSAVRADGFFIIEADVERLAAGSDVTVYIY